MRRRSGGSGRCPSEAGRQAGRRVRRTSLPVLPPGAALPVGRRPPLLGTIRIVLGHLIAGLGAGRVDDPRDVAAGTQHVTHRAAEEAVRLIRRFPRHDVVVDRAYNVVLAASHQPAPAAGRPASAHAAPATVVRQVRGEVPGAAEHAGARGVEGVFHRRRVGDQQFVGANASNSRRRPLAFASAAGSPASQLAGHLPWRAARCRWRSEERRLLPRPGRGAASQVRGSGAPPCQAQRPRRPGRSSARRQPEGHSGHSIAGPRRARGRRQRNQPGLPRHQDRLSIRMARSRPAGRLLYIIGLPPHMSSQAR